MQANEPFEFEPDSDFEYTDADSASLVRGLVRQIRVGLSSTILDYYKSGQLLCEIRNYLGYGQFTKWLNTSEWEYSQATAYKCFLVYERCQELKIKTEWFGTLFIISVTQLVKLLRRDSHDIIVELLKIIKAGKTVNNKVIAQITSVVQPQLNSANKVTAQKATFRSNPLNYLWSGLRFRSKPEVQIAKALEQYDDVAYWPNCKGRLYTPKGKLNLEPDFLICYQGNWGILEVDGPFHTPQRRVEEQERERYFRHHRIRVVERFDAQRCEQEPTQVVEEFLQIMNKMY